MESGNIVEYIDRQKIMCAVVLETKKQGLRLLNENNRELKLSENRLSHKSKMRLDLSMSRDKLTETLKEMAGRRSKLTGQVDIGELWEVLNSEQEWIDLPTMTEFCFPDNPDGDHESAVVRAFFYDRIYFKFDHNRFFPYSEDKVEQIRAQAEEAARKNRAVETGGNWLKNMLTTSNPTVSRDKWDLIEMLKSVYLFEKESSHYDMGKAMLEKAGIDIGDRLFKLLVRLKIWNMNENLDIYRYEILTEFPDKVIDHSKNLKFENLKLETGNLKFETGNLKLETGSGQAVIGDQHNRRRDLTMLPLITIDGQLTLDFDDALSIEQKDDHFYLGVHIADVGHYVSKGDPIDKEAVARASSIYMPDRKISMIPASLSEDLCSLKEGEVRPAISVMITLDHDFDITGYEVFPSLVRVAHQRTYYDVNLTADEEKDILILCDIAKKFRQKRLADGAVQISLPEINIWLDESGEPVLSKTDRESPGRLLVTEIMIMANWLMARFLTDHKLPAVFRSQPEPKDRLYRDDEGTLFQNWMQRKLLNRFVLGHDSEHHSGLGLDAYVTATSPIRKYFDLVTQRQIRAVFDMEIPYKHEEISYIIQSLEQPMSCVSRLQYQRKRYWLLKYLERKAGEKGEAIVLYRRKSDYVALMTEYMTECNLPLSSGMLKPEDMVQITIQNVNARKDLLSVFIG
ncbi:MAG: RNB domain-containing ribonuclease [Desulfobacteraceae bacterium]|nr:RNB domain-containing ribonuclease [Desulfobacteraceae bacterium]